MNGQIRLLKQLPELGESLGDVFDLLDYNPLRKDHAVGKTGRTSAMETAGGHALNCPGLCRFDRQGEISRKRKRFLF